MAKRISRRELIKTTAAAAAASALRVPAHASNPKRLPPNDRIRFAAIGTGGRGAAHLDPAFQHGDLVALCDVDAETLCKALLNYPAANTFNDYRQMFDAMHDKIDAVIVATPDHHHAPASAMAIKLGKHVYCEKPLTRTVFEARKLAQLAREHKVATQMGNQGTAGSDLRRVAALAKKGTWGEPKEVHCWTDRAGGWWPQGVERPPSKPAPKTVNWDVWLGPSPWRDYADGYHPFAWRGWWDFGCGALGDIGCHCMNLPYMALDLRDPLAISAETSGNNKQSFPAWSIVHYEFGPTKTRGPVALHWYDGGKKPDPALIQQSELPGNGCIMVFEHATIFAPAEYGQGGTIVGGAPMPEVEFEVSPGHFEEWVLAIKGGKPAKSDIALYSGGLTEMVVLGNLAVWAGERLEWDARKMRVKNRPEFDAMIKPAYRKGWSL